MAIKNQLENKVAIITGASRGIGKATAHRFAQAGASVVLAARSASEIQAVAEQIKANGGRALAIPTDVTDQTSIDQLVILTMRAFRHIDILVNNAGILAPIGRTWEVDPIQWKKLIDINVNGPYLCTRSILPQMLDRGDGHIINITSGAANKDVVGWSAYCSSKAALNRFTGVLAKEVADKHIVVCGVNPGVTDTAMQTQIRQASAASLPVRDYFIKRFEQGDIASPKDVAELILWVATQTNCNGSIFDLENEAVWDQVQKDLS